VGDKNNRSEHMRSLILATTAAIGIGLLGVSGASAAPANGVVIDKAVAADQLAAQDVGYRYRYRGYGYRGYGYRGYGYRGYGYRGYGYGYRYRRYY